MGRLQLAEHEWPFSLNSFDISTPSFNFTAHHLILCELIQIYGKYCSQIYYQFE